MDILIVADVSGTVYLVENTFFYTLKNNLKTAVKTDSKQPFFSLGFSSSTSLNSVAQLTTETHVIKENTPEKLPYFSFGFFKSKPKADPEPKESPIPHSQPSQPTQVEHVDSSKPKGGSKRVQINRNDILSGNYSFTPAGSAGTEKAKVDESKINEVRCIQSSLGIGKDRETY